MGYKEKLKSLSRKIPKEKEKIIFFLRDTKEYVDGQTNKYRTPPEGAIIIDCDSQDMRL